MSAVVAPEEVGRLIDLLRACGHRVLGPRLRDGAIVYDDVAVVDDLPAGWTDEHDPGRYGVHRREDGALFGYAVGPDSWKRLFLPPREVVMTSTRDHDTFRVAAADPDPQPVALLGVRACDLAAMRVQDQVLLRGAFPDTSYASRRDRTVLIAVNCLTPGATCFCASMGTGPSVGEGADLVLTELLGDGRHEILVEPATPLGEELLEQLDSRPADDRDHQHARRELERAAGQMGRQLDADSVHDTLLGSLDHPQWDDVAERCLACGNCTLVCPTCFCTEFEDTTSLDGETAQRQRRWDSCFNLAHSHAGPGSVRSSVRSRYRQWATHKLATWIDQFGTSGCVGCGRCITWCPVGIDLTAEVAAIAAADARSDSSDDHEGVRT